MSPRLLAVLAVSTILVVGLAVPVALATPSTEDDQFEPNDRPDEASIVDPGGYESLILRPGDRDFFAVRLEEDERLTARIDFDHRQGDLDLTVRAPSGEIVARSLSRTDDELASVSVDEDGFYVIEVSGHDDAGGRYDLNVSVEQPATSDPTEPNDRFGTATELSTGTRVGGLRVADGDSDYFAIDLQEGERLTVRLSFAHSAGDLDFELYDPRRRLLASSTSTTDDERVDVRAPSSGTYYVHVYGFLDATAPYTITTSSTDRKEGTTGDGTSFEPNDRFTSATPVGDGTYAGRILDGESDYFAVTLSAGEELTADVSFSHDRGDLDLEVYGPDREELAASVSTTDGERVSLTAPRTGSYFVHVYGYAGASAPYDLSIQRTTITNDRLEPDESFTEATLLAVGDERTDLQIVEGERDRFAIPVEANRTIRVRAVFSDAEGDLDLTVYGPTRMPVAESRTVTDNETVTVRTDSAGTYYVEVRGFDGATAPYAIRTAAVNGTDDGDRDLRRIAYEQSRAGELTAADPRSIANRGYYEPVTFRGEAGDRVDVHMTTETGQPSVLLRGPNGTVLARNSGTTAGVDAHLDAVALPADGRYTIVATSRWHEATFAYNLTLERDSDPEPAPLSLSVSDATVEPGDAGTVTFAVENTGNETRAVVLESGTRPLPEQWRVVSHTDDGARWRAGERAWVFGDIAPGERRVVTVTVRAPAAESTPVSQSLPVRAFTAGRIVSETARITVGSDR